MKTVRIVIEVPLPDEGTQEDAESLANYIARLALTTNPPPPTLGIASSLGVGLPKVFGRIIKVKIKDDK